MTRRFADTAPIYMQIIETVKVEIVSGKYKTGDKLPGVRDLAVEYGVNPNTVQRALSELEREGLLQSERTSGRFVSIDEDKITKLKKSLSEDYIKDLFEKMNQIGMSDSEIRKAVSKWGVKK